MMVPFTLISGPNHQQAAESIYIYIKIYIFL